jgi:hypothetical protein
LPSHPPTGATAASYGIVGGAEGGIFDALLGVGIGARVHGRWSVFAEVAGRIGLGFTGTMYDRVQCLCLHDPYPGKDVFAASVGVGLSLED